jgi:hypothetical protein
MTRNVDVLRKPPQKEERCLTFSPISAEAQSILQLPLNREHCAFRKLSSNSVQYQRLLSLA